MISGTISRSAAGRRGATKYTANPASASTQCTISHAGHEIEPHDLGAHAKRRPADRDGHDQAVERMAQSRAASARR